ncbi:MAG: hypothetical protein KF777_19760 [Planctomycetaceae bacterium]|nr:hypothetical protein [Planctomycetaceae bacterium]
MIDWSGALLPAVLLLPVAGLVIGIVWRSARVGIAWVTTALWLLVLVAVVARTPAVGASAGLVWERPILLLDVPGVSTYDVPCRWELSERGVSFLLAIGLAGFGLLLAGLGRASDEEARRSSLLVLAMLGLWAMLVCSTHLLLTCLAWLAMNTLAFAWRLAVDDGPAAGRTARRVFLSNLPGDLGLVVVVTALGAAAHLSTTTLFTTAGWEEVVTRFPPLSTALLFGLWLVITFRTGLFPWSTWRDAAESRQAVLSVATLDLLLLASALWLWSEIGERVAGQELTRSLMLSLGGLTCLLGGLCAANSSDGQRAAAWGVSWQVGWSMVMVSIFHEPVSAGIARTALAMGGSALLAVIGQTNDGWRRAGRWLGWLSVLGVLPIGRNFWIEPLLAGDIGAIVKTPWLVLSLVGWGVMALQVGKWTREAEREEISVARGSPPAAVLWFAACLLLGWGLFAMSLGSVSALISAATGGLMGLGVLAVSGLGSRPGSIAARLVDLPTVGAWGRLGRQRFAIDQVWFLLVNLPTRILAQLLRFGDWFVVDRLAFGLPSFLVVRMGTAVRLLQTGDAAFYTLTVVLSVVVLALVLGFGR